MKYFIETYGCQMNVHDSERMAGLLEASGYEPAASDADADLVVINTCSVREKAEDKLYTRLGDIKGSPTRDRTCAACRRRRLRRATGRDATARALIAHRRRRRHAARQDAADCSSDKRADPHRPRMRPLAALVDVSTPYDEPSFPFGLTRHADPVKAYVTIIEGCNDFCAFCVVPYTRGHERMRAKAEILADVRHAVAHGRAEIQLLGQIVNHYQAPDDPRCDFAGLLEAVNEVPGVRRIRFASPHPRHASARLIAAVRDLPAVCKHMHLPVQSGVASMLQRMRRRHTREQYLDLVSEIRAAIPDDPALDRHHHWIPRGDRGGIRGDPVARRDRAVPQHVLLQVLGAAEHTRRRRRLPDDVAEVEKTRRIRGLQLTAAAHPAGIARRIGRPAGRGPGRGAQPPAGLGVSGRTTGNTVVNLPGRPNWVGQFIDVEIKRAGPNSVWGEPIAEDARRQLDGVAAEA